MFLPCSSGIWPSACSSFSSLQEFGSTRWCYGTSAPVLGLLLSNELRMWSDFHSIIQAMCPYELELGAGCTNPADNGWHRPQEAVWGRGSAEANVQVWPFGWEPEQAGLCAGTHTSGLLGEKAWDTGLQGWPCQVHPSRSCPHPPKTHQVQIPHPHSQSRSLFSIPFSLSLSVTHTLFSFFSLFFLFTKMRHNSDGNMSKQSWLSITVQCMRCARRRSLMK